MRASPDVVPQQISNYLRERPSCAVRSFALGCTDTRDRRHIVQRGNLCIYLREPLYLLARTFVLRRANLRTSLREARYPCHRRQRENLYTHLREPSYLLARTFVLTCANLRTYVREPLYLDALNLRAWRLCRSCVVFLTLQMHSHC